MLCHFDNELIFLGPIVLNVDIGHTELELLWLSRRQRLVQYGMHFQINVAFLRHVD